MDFDEFVNKLYEAGWDSPNDAQWTGAKKLWNELLQEGIKVYLPPNDNNQPTERTCYERKVDGVL